MDNYLKNIGIENFRVFNEEQNFNFADITILTGTNSSGKSSLINALKFLKESYKDLPKENYLESLFQNASIEFINRNFGKKSNTLNRNSGSDVFAFSEKVTVPIFGIELGCTRKYIFKVRKHPRYIENETLELESIKLIIDSIENSRVCESILQMLKANYNISSLENTTILELKYHWGNDYLMKHPIAYIRFDIFYTIFNEYNNYYLQLVPEIESLQDLCINSGKETVELDFKDFLFREKLEGKITKRVLNNEIVEWLDVPTLDEFRMYQRTFYFDMMAPAQELVINNERQEYLKTFIQQLFQNQIKEIDDINDLIKEYHKGEGVEENNLRFIKDLLKIASTIGVTLPEEHLKVDFFHIIYFMMSSLSQNHPDLNEYIEKTDLTHKEFFALTQLYEKLDKIDRQSPQKGTSSFFESKFIKPINGLVEHANTLVIKASGLLFINNREMATDRTLKIKSSNELKHLQQLSVHKRLGEMLAKFIVLFGIGEKFKIDIDEDIMTYKILILKEDEWKNIKDEGYGITRLIPLLFLIEPIESDTQDGFEREREGIRYQPQTVVLEEPEANLHPALQSRLADFIAEMSNNYNIRFVIETHSEYFIRKLQYLTAKKEIEPDKTQIYYFHHPDRIPEGEKQIYPINIREDGSLTKNFGNGFFDEAGKQELELYKLIKNYLSDGTSLN